MTQEQSPATRGRNELLTALRDANEGWLPGVGKVFTVTLDPAERDILTSALSETACTKVEILGHEGKAVSARCILSGCQDFTPSAVGTTTVYTGIPCKHFPGRTDVVCSICNPRETSPSAIGTRDAALEESAAICDQQAEAWQQAHNEGSEILAYEDQALHGVANLIRTLKGKS